MIDIQKQIDDWKCPKCGESLVVSDDYSTNELSSLLGFLQTDDKIEVDINDLIEIRRCIKCDAEFYLVEIKNEGSYKPYENKWIENTENNRGVGNRQRKSDDFLCTENRRFSLPSDSEGGC